MSDYQSNPEKHADSTKKYPFLNLSDGEFVIADVRRHPIGLFSIWFADLLVALVALVLAAFVSARSDVLESSGVAINPNLVLFALALVTILVLLFGFVAASIYRDNHFYVTNESVIQKIRTGLFSGREQIISLGGVEDASFRQSGILQYMLGYGLIRLSTVGDETTYRFTPVANPAEQLRVLNEAVEDFKKRRHDDDPTND